MTPKPRRASREEIGIATRWLEVLATDPVGPGEYVKALLAHIAYLEAREARLVEALEVLRPWIDAADIDPMLKHLDEALAFDPAAEEEKRV